MEHKRISFYRQRIPFVFIKRLPDDWSYTCTSTTRSRNHCEQSRRTYSIGAHLYYAHRRAHRIQRLQSTWLSVSSGLR